MQEFIVGVDSLIYSDLVPVELHNAPIDGLAKAELAGLDPAELHRNMHDRAQEVIRDAHRALAVFGALQSKRNRPTSTSLGSSSQP